MTDLFGNPDPDPTPARGGSLSFATGAEQPLAVRMRPLTMDEIVGQQHLLAPGSPLRSPMSTRSSSAGKRAIAGS